MGSGGPPKGPLLPNCYAGDSGLGLYVKDVIARALRLRGRVDDELAIITEPRRPCGDIGGGVVDGAVFDTGDPA
jgi:hypothetical protein